MTSRNGKIRDGLIRSAAEGRLHHAYILSGPAKDAKVSCVEDFAASIFSSGAGGLFGGNSDPESQKDRIRRRNHPDFYRIEEQEELENSRSLLEQIRDLPKILSFPPLESSRRVILIPDAAKLNDSACNSILKILEEPPPHSMFFLLCRDVGELLQTIVSRCQVLRFAPLTDAEILELVPEAAEGQRSGAVLAWSEGAVERARFLLEQENALELQRSSCEMLLDLWEASPRIPSSSFSWVEKLEGDESGQVVLDSWEILLRDLAFVAVGASKESLRQQGYHDRLLRLVSGWGKGVSGLAASKASAINRFRVYRELNGNFRTDFAALLCELQFFPAKENSQA